MTDDYDLYAVLEVAPHARPAVIDAAFGVLREAVLAALPELQDQLTRVHQMTKL